MKIKALFTVIFILFLIPGCGGNSSNTTGQDLYIAYCSSCHGVDGKSGTAGVDIRGRSQDQISIAIATIPDMHNLDFLSSSEIMLISQYLADLKNNPNSKPTVGRVIKGHATKGSTPLAGEVIVRDSQGQTRNVQIGQAGIYQVDVNGMEAPFLVRVNTLNDNRTFYSYSTTAGSMDISPLTDLIAREALEQFGIDRLFENCLPASKNCFAALTANRIEEARVLTLANFSSEFNQTGVDADQFNPVAPVDSAQRSSYTLLNDLLESTRLAGCANPINPQGYHYDDDTAGSCFHSDDDDLNGFHDDDLNKDGFHDNDCDRDGVAGC